ncbi:hypothetical protein DICPUDRAFT_99093 [Dictyostelium purpureum]|uniref:Ras guanine nucleotide exchange factor n=1 Tax=Dictyostelium purpureum TaxID=5786 RepID=F0ZW84_DICPU|nr:uncharacterized protein DICPUDRAFT_99093 [Dictyostelium purpureum]EGC31783.1 hypothetical protein DICPUDRAFT_99093 [Dictyostelium purpureum]|eukprot:XP_003291678.1 hypothetical protein DICPUDRAFT_99093 [Dictyostelium purpureum]
MVVVIWGWQENKFTTLNEIILFDFIEDNKKLYFKIFENERKKVYSTINVIGRKMDHNINNNNSNNSNNKFILSSNGSQWFNLNKGIIIVECENDIFLIEEIDLGKFPILGPYIKNEEFMGTSLLENISTIEKQAQSIYSMKSNQLNGETMDRKYKSTLDDFRESIVQLEKHCKYLLKRVNLINQSIKYSVIKSIKFLLKEIKFEYYHGDINIKRIELFSQLKKYLKIHFWSNNLSLINSNVNDMSDSNDSISSVDDSNSPSNLNSSLSSFPSISSPSNSSFNNINALTFSNNNHLNGNYNIDDTSSNYTDCTNTTNSTTTTTTTTTTTPNNNFNYNTSLSNSGCNTPTGKKLSLKKMGKTPSFKIQLIQEVYLEIMDQCKKIKNNLYELLDKYQSEYIEDPTTNSTNCSIYTNTTYAVTLEIIVMLIKNSKDFNNQIKALDMIDSKKRSIELTNISTKLFLTSLVLFPTLIEYFDNDLIEKQQTFSPKFTVKTPKLPSPLKNIINESDDVFENEFESINNKTAAITINNEKELNNLPIIVETSSKNNSYEKDDLVLIINQILTILELFIKEYTKSIGNNDIYSPCLQQSIQSSASESISPKCGLFLSHSLSTDSPMTFVKRNITSSSPNSFSSNQSPLNSQSPSHISTNPAPTPPPIVIPVPVSTTTTTTTTSNLTLSSTYHHPPPLFNRKSTTGSIVSSPNHYHHIGGNNNQSAMSPSMFFNHTGSPSKPGNANASSVGSAESTPTFQLDLCNTMEMLSSLKEGKDKEMNNDLLIPNGANGLIPHKSIGKSFSTGNFSPTVGRTSSFEENQLQTAIDNVIEVFPNLTKKTVDTSIWIEEEKEFINVHYINNTNSEDKNYKTIKHASLNQLILKLTSETHTELKFAKTFITTYRSFTTAEIFLSKLIQRYFTPNLRNITPHIFIQKIQTPIQLRVLNVLRLWIEQYPADFHKEILKTLTSFLNATRKNGHGQLSDLILKKFNNTKSPERLVVPAVVVPKQKIFWKKYTSEYIFSLSSNDIAEQLTLLDFDSYKSIEEIELLNQAWSKPEQKINTPNIVNMVNRFNNFSSFVSWAILRENDVKTRSKMMLKMIKICYALYKLSNFNGLIAGLSGLNTTAVYRLNYTKSLIAKQYQKKFDLLCSFIETKKSHKTYRDLIHSTCPPLIPYLGIYLTDLTFIEDGNQDEIKGLINFKKRDLIYNTILEIQQYQQQGYTIKPKNSVLSFLCELPSVNDKKKFEDELYEQSILLEPKNFVPKK